MPDIYDSDIVEKQPERQVSEEELIGKLFEYTEKDQNPWLDDYRLVIKKCYDFIELDQWSSVEKRALDTYGVPALAVDRLNRGVDTIKGIRENSKSKKRIVKREMGDERIAEMLDKLADHARYAFDLDSAKDTAFETMIHVGIGLRKLGWDSARRRIWSDPVNTENFGYSPSKTRELTDIHWCWEHQTMDWEQIVSQFPHKAGELKSMRASQAVSEFDKLPGNNTSVTNATKDYGTTAIPREKSTKVGSVHLWEFWIQRIIPFQKVGFNAPSEDPDGQVVMMPQYKQENLDYKPAEGEESVGFDVIEEWWQYVVAASGNEGKSGAVLLSQAKHDWNWHPYCAEMADKKHSGMPFGYVEKNMPHQIRINLAWGQKMCFNNRTLLNPIITKNIVDLDKKLKQTPVGVWIPLSGQETIERMNEAPPLDLQAIEEGNIARQDMDFSAAATEPAIRGQAAASDSGLKTSIQQSAALTPLNKFTQAESRSEVVFWKKVLDIIIAKYTADDIQRILGSDFMKLAGPVISPAGQLLEAPMEFPLKDLSIDEYDVKIEDEAISDFQKQQSFNAIIAMKEMGILFEDETIIKSAPVKNVDELVESNKAARADMIRQLLVQVQMLSQQNQELQKMAGQAQKQGQPSGKSSQAGNAARGRMQPQNGARKMLGGVGPNTSV